MTDAPIGCVDLMVDRHVRAGRGVHAALVEAGVPGAGTQRRLLTYAALQQVTQGIARELA